MTTVVIVGKTKMRQKRCIGALGVNENRSYRLLTSSGQNFPKNTEFNLGQVWDLDLQEVSNHTPPHIEDIRILGQRLTRTLSMPQLREFLGNRVAAPVVSPKKLFGRRIRFTTRKKALVYRYGSVPQHSTGFWRLKKELHKRIDDDGRVRYLYCKDDTSCDFSDEDLVLDVGFVGCEVPRENIPRGTLLRFSLSREHRAGKYNGFWLQLSGWFL